MITLALTGSIGMGKSTVAAMFERAGIPVFDADAIVRDLQGPGGELVASIEACFPGTTGPTGVDRDALSKRVVGDPDALERLEAIVHPVVHRARARFLLDNADKPALLFEIPLLFETGGGQAFDKVVVVSAPAEVQRERVLSRPGMTEEKFEALQARQMPDDEKRKRADFVIDAGGDLSTTETEVRHILSCLGLAAGD
ncbi:MAG TPA: dephospho-CoA kinase [Sphingomicrobium sp.]|jgi:dephospho-CoA kinase|nr:dephospho-CoA kinase [Sphingomicrobium sp.]